MNKETQKKLTKDFPKSVVKKAPQGKFGDYVPHHIYTQRLVDVIGGGYDFTFEETRDKTGAIIGAKCRLYIKSTDQTIEEVGDVDVNAVKRNITESEILKLAVSDGIKRCCMRLGIGLELWTGGVTEEEHYAEVQTSKPKMTKDKEDIKVLEKAKKDFAKDVEEQPNNAQQLNTFMTATVSDEVVKAVIKRDVYRDVVSKGFPEEVEDWDDKQVEIFKDLVFETQQVDEKKTDLEIVEEVFGEVQDKTRSCPECGKTEYIEDNRQKKQDDPDKYGKIPSWSCSKYQGNMGCGWTAWGDTDCPTEWL